MPCQIQLQYHPPSLRALFYLKVFCVPKKMHLDKIMNFIYGATIYKTSNHVLIKEQHG